jgi:hypothetical protein
MRKQEFKDRFIKRSIIATISLIVLFTFLIWKVDYLISVLFDF